MRREEVQSAAAALMELAELLRAAEEHQEETGRMFAEAEREVMEKRDALARDLAENRERLDGLRRKLGAARRALLAGFDQLEP